MCVYNFDVLPTLLLAWRIFYCPAIKIVGVRRRAEAMDIFFVHHYFY